MKRKVIKLADTTYVVSLPLKWARKHKIQKGQQVEVQERGTQITIIAKGEAPLKKGKFEAQKFGQIVKRAFDAMYKIGYDEIEINYNNKYQLKEVEDSVNSEAMTFEIVKQEKNKCIVRSITEASDKEFDSVLRRTVLLLKVMGEDLLKAIQEKDYDTIANIRDLEKTNNKLTHYLRRALNKHGYKDPEKTNVMYTLAEQLEKLADEFKYLCNFLTDKRNRKLTLSGKTIILFEKLNKSLDIFSKIFFDLKPEKAVEFDEIKKNVIQTSIELFQTQPAKEVVVIHYILNLEQELFDMLGPILALYL